MRCQNRITKFLQVFYINYDFLTELIGWKHRKNSVFSTLFYIWGPITFTPDKLQLAITNTPF